MSALASSFGTNESVQTVTLTYAATSTSATIANAIRKGSGMNEQSLAAMEKPVADGGFGDDGVVWLLPLVNSSGSTLSAPQVGDTIVDEDSNTWSILEVGKPAGSLWRCVCT